MSTNDDGPGRPVSRDEPYYREGTGPGKLPAAHCASCDEPLPWEDGDYRWYVVKAIRAGWRLAKLTTGDEWTCPGCAAIMRAKLDSMIREENQQED